MEDDPARPSTWQLLFGANKNLTTTSANNQHDAPEVSPDGVSTQLWTALQSREPQTEADAIGRQCSDALLGKKNAFAPQLRRPEDITTRFADDLEREAKRQARALISTRFKIDQQATAIRQGKRQAQQQRHDHMRVRPSTPTATATTRPRGGTDTAGTTERLKKLHEIQTRRQEFEKTREHEQARRQQQQQQKNRPGKTTPREIPTANAKTSKAVTTPHNAAEEATRAKTQRRPVHKDDPPKQPATTVDRTNQENDDVEGDLRRPGDHGVSSKFLSKDPNPKPLPSTRDLRVLDDKIRHLRAENQQVVALDEKLRAQQRLVRIKRRVWTIWQHRIERRRHQETSIVRGFEWRLLQRLWAAWRCHARTTKDHRVAQQTRELLVRGKRQLETADRFYRARHLVLWFQRWRAVASAAGEAKALETQMQKRREKAARLLQRLASGEKESSVVVPATPHSTSPPPLPEKPTVVRKQPRVNQRTEPPRGQRRETEMPPPLAPLAKPTVSTTTTTAAVALPSPDAFYVSMQARAEQRKAQREQLKQKYETLDQEKRDALALQVAEREALLERQKQNEKDRVRDKKREAARVARQLEVRRHVAAVQQQSAALHDRLRLLFHYAWRPWQRAWLVSKRVARNATAWHELRVAHDAWRHWLGFVRVQRVQRRLLQQEKMAIAAAHHRLTLLKTVVADWKLALNEMQLRQLAVQRHVQCNETRRAWRRWHHAFAVVVRVTTQRESHARRHLERRRLRLVVATWRERAAEQKRDRVRQAEKDMLWKKARMWLND